LDTSVGKLIFHVLVSIAEFRREPIRERTIAGLESTKGCHGGRPRALDEGKARREG
jgi:DNA invertase Pin-like site-specific DNA recombinase